MNWIAANFLVVVTVIATLAVLVLILQQRRTPQSTAAWLLFVILLPYVAIPVFLALGFRKQGSGFPIVRFSAKPTKPHTRSRLESVLQQYDLPAASTGNRLDLLVDGVDTWNAVKSLIESAQDDLDVAFYLIADDPVGRAFVDLLAERAAAGVRVRLIIDRLGGFLRPRGRLARFRAAGGEIRYFSPLLNVPDKGHFNLRNHRKVIIADGTRVFAGGRNIGRDYLGPAPDPDRWIDLSCLVEGPVSRAFADVFASDWRVAAGDRTIDRPSAQSRPGDAILQLVPSGPDMHSDPLHDALVNAIHAAHRRVWIATPYFLPTEHLEHALGTAAQRGLDVRILVPRKSNHRIADFARGAYLRSLEDYGCTILLYDPGVMHAKAGIIDDAAWMGSANFDIRSMLLNFEISLFIYDDISVGQLQSWFRTLEQDCTIGLSPAGLRRRIVEGFFRLGAPEM